MAEPQTIAVNQSLIFKNEFDNDSSRYSLQTGSYSSAIRPSSVPNNSRTEEPNRSFIKNSSKSWFAGGKIQK